MRNYWEINEIKRNHHKKPPFLKYYILYQYILYKNNRKDMKLTFKPRKVYHIILDENIIYVGSTQQTLKRRLGIHKHSEQHQVLRDRFNDLIIEEIDMINTPEELKKEGEWINKYREIGYNLLNKQNSYWLDYGGKWGTYNAEYMAEHQKEWYQDNRQKWNTYMREFMRKKLNISENNYRVI